MIRTASAYVRRSKKADERTVSLSMQREAIAALAKREGYTVTQWFEEERPSGKQTEWQPWLASAEHVDALIAYAVDRSSRSGLEGALMLGRVPEQTDTRVLTCDGLDSRDRQAFEWQLIIKSQIAKEERERIRQRSVDSRAQMLAENKWPSGQPPYGTRLDADRRLEVDPAEREVLREVYERLVRGESVRSVLLWMNDQGLTTRRGNPWTRSSLTTTLESETTRDGVKIFTLAEQRALTARLHPKPGTRPKGGKPVKWLLSGYAACAGCKRPMTTSRDRKRGVTRYVCPTTSSVAPCPARATIRADRVDAFVEERYLATWGDLSFWEEIVEVDGEEIDNAERARDETQEALNFNPTAETLAAYQQAKQSLEDALARPAVRRRRLVEADTYGQQWKKAKERTSPMTGEPDPDTVRMAQMIRQATRRIEIKRSDSPKWDEARIDIDWTHEGDPVDVEP